MAGPSFSRLLRAIAPMAALTAACRVAEPGRLAPQQVCTHSPCVLDSIAGLLDSALAAGAAPGGVLAVSWEGKRYIYGAGRLALDDPRRPDGHTIYDLASLTKVVVTTTLTMLAVSEGRIDLDDPAVRYLPGFGGPGKERVTVRHLLTHSSGLRADRPLWRQAPDRDSAIRLVNQTPLDTAPGMRTVYSDLGAIVLGELIQRVYRSRLDRLARTRILDPLGMVSTGFRPPERLHYRVAATEYDTAWRKRIVRGEVHDEKAAWLGGVAGHAGLFGSAVDLLAFGEWMISAGRADRAANRPIQESAELRAADPARTTGPAVHPSVVGKFTRRQNLVPGSSRALGWDTPAPGSSAGNRLSGSSFGHTGFTGTSIWIDPAKGLVIVLLTNRVHPTRNNPNLGPLRVAVSNRVVELLGAAAPGISGRALR